jgi:hypothetical protein
MQKLRRNPEEGSYWEADTNETEIIRNIDEMLDLGIYILLFSQDLLIQTSMIFT